MDLVPTEQANLTGTLLLAHPKLKDPHFNKSVILVTSHHTTLENSGATGVVLNHPLGVSLGDVQANARATNLADVPLFYGGPVSTSQVILTGWQWLEHTRMFKLYFGISGEVATEMKLMFPELHLRAFLGYSGWGAGQIEQEVKANAWLTTPLQSILNNTGFEKQMWFHLMSTTNPLMLVLNSSPEDVLVN